MTLQKRIYMFYSKQWQNVCSNTLGLAGEEVSAKGSCTFQGPRPNFLHLPACTPCSFGLWAASNFDIDLPCPFPNVFRAVIWKMCFFLKFHYNCLIFILHILRISADLDRPFQLVITHRSEFMPPWVIFFEADLLTTRYRKPQALCGEVLITRFSIKSCICRSLEPVAKDPNSREW